MSALLFGSRAAFQQLCDRNRASKLFHAIAQFDINGENVMLAPVEGKAGYLAARLVQLVLLLLPVWKIQRLFLLVNQEYQVISLQSLEARYPAILKAQGRFDQARRVEQLEQNCQCFEAILDYLKTQGTLYKIDSGGVYLEAFYRHSSPRITAEQMVGRSLFQVLPPENWDAAQTILKAVQYCIASGKRLEITYPIWERHYQAVLIPIKDQSFCYAMVNRVNASNR
ncbi:hypothetical protein [Stenomitos frigidus]|uniref:Uncharacterized protein n=1 Tax=Stenomitos frigidus ULC18 TaxID=2107698 RepID=A0A2T1DYB5_9CYAN|nr:hypothetical protein [Stenomitos frigidus]PSB25374.1 hypothetical protein C7B82_23890 [Stenomitos frigidus ULC18]